jgi:hypothetical protein
LRVVNMCQYELAKKAVPIHAARRPNIVRRQPKNRRTVLRLITAEAIRAASIGAVPVNITSAMQ